MENNKVLKVEISKDRYCSCNACHKRVSPKEKDANYAVTEMYDLQFGSEGYTVVVRLCNECLNEFADKLWNFLESEDK